MLEIDEKAVGIFTVNMGIPEMYTLRRIAGAYSFNDATALIAVINRGMDSIGEHVKEVTRDEELDIAGDVDS